MSDGLVELLDRLLDTGAVVAGDVTLAVAGIDLAQVRLQALASSIEALQRAPDRPRVAWTPPPPRRRRRAPSSLPTRIDADPERVERALGQLIVVVADLLRELLERQAMRRIVSGSLTVPEVERLSAAFEALDAKLDQLLTEGFEFAPTAGPRVGSTR